MRPRKVKTIFLIIAVMNEDEKRGYRLDIQKLAKLL